MKPDAITMSQGAGDGARTVGGPLAAAPDRAPYGRRKGRDGGFPERPYGGETYYDRPAIKPSHWGGMITVYYFAGGLAGAAQILATVADLAGAGDDRTIVRGGRYLSLAALLISPPLLIADLHTPARFYNMLRIVRPTSPMSIGSWTLSVFGAFTALTALAQALDDLTAFGPARSMARWAGVPAAAAGMVMATYTGALSTATSVPLWAAVPRSLPALFGMASTETAVAALSLIAEATHAPARAHLSLERISLIVGVAELALHAAMYRIWHERQVAGPLDTPRLGPLYRFGMIGMGTIVPVAIHAAQQLSGRRSRRASIVSAVATIAGVLIERAVIIYGGNESARRATDYLRFTQPRDTQGGTR